MGKEHKKGKVAEGKVNRNYRMNVGVVRCAKEEAIRLGFGERGTATFINNLLTRYFNGEHIQRDPSKF